MTTEQQLLDKYYNNDYTKTISDLIGDLQNIQASKNYSRTTEQVQTQLRSDFPNISDWSF
tara:strand:+ start:230 stop:409 length:180 start_codon:yes stop_codon:yes gene_type:complete